MFVLPPYLQDAITIFMGIFIEAVPFILMGVLVSAILHVYVRDEVFLRFFPKNPFLQMVFTCCFGFLFPVCECGNVPVARRLIGKGVHPHAAIAFLLAAPVFNPIVILATYAAFRTNPEMVWYRVILSVAIALIVGGLFYLTFRRNPELQKEWVLVKHEPAGRKHSSSKLTHMVSTARSEFFEMGGILVLGGLIASATQAFIPRNIIVSIGRGPVLSVIAMMIFAAMISICSNVDSFFALGYTTQFTNGALLAFLVFGPMIDIKAVLMMRTMFSWRAISWMVTLVMLLSFVGTVFLNMFVL